MNRKEIAKSYFARVTAGDLDAVNDLLTPDFVDHDSPPGTPAGPEAAKAFAGAMISHHPDLTVEVEDVFAIAATLLILEIRLPDDVSVAHGLVHAWPSYVAYATSFLTIGIIWVNHHTVLHQIGRVDRTFLFINVVFLMIV